MASKEFHGPPVTVVSAVNAYINTQPTGDFLFAMDSDGNDLVIAVVPRRTGSVRHQLTITTDVNLWTFKNQGNRFMVVVGGQPYYIGEIF